jgi:hypothetical protein
MPNIASSNLEDFAGTISGHGEDSPVNDHIISLLRSLALMTDNEILNVSYPYWRSHQDVVEDVLKLPKGSRTDFTEEELLKAATHLKMQCWFGFSAKTQSDIISRVYKDE